MKIQLSDLTTERTWRAATGFDKQRFEKLLGLFKIFYVKIYGKPVQERQVQTEIAYCLNSEEELLFFTLCSLKSGLTYDLLGLVCGMEAIKRLIPDTKMHTPSIFNNLRACLTGYARFDCRLL